jgi:hypothetical protein
MALSLHPVGAERVVHSLLLQYYIVLPVTLDGDGLARVRERLTEIKHEAVVDQFAFTGPQ